MWRQRFERATTKGFFFFFLQKESISKTSFFPLFFFLLVCLFVYCRKKNCFLLFLLCEMHKGKLGEGN